MLQNFSWNIINLRSDVASEKWKFLSFKIHIQVYKNSKFILMFYNIWDYYHFCQYLYWLIHHCFRVLEKTVKRERKEMKDFDELIQFLILINRKNVLFQLSVNFMRWFYSVILYYLYSSSIIHYHPLALRSIFLFVHIFQSYGMSYHQITAAGIFSKIS